ncbi:MAG: response regulator [Armatimonadia bacterium]|nr:response regulator [Armatimonadia bacterium]
MNALVITGGVDWVVDLTDRLTEPGTYDLVVVDDEGSVPGDLPLGEMDMLFVASSDGRESLAESVQSMRAKAPLAFVVALTELGDLEAAAEIAQAGADDIVLKAGEGPELVLGTLPGFLERYRSIHRLRLWNDRFRSIVRSSADAILVLSREGQVRFINPAAADLLCRTAGEVVGTEFGFPLVVGETTEIDLLLPGDTAVVAEMRVVEVEWQGESCFLAALRDITLRRQTEARRNRLEAMLRQAQKVESLALFAGGIAHDFNNMLMGILGHADLALGELDPDDSARARIRQIESVALQAARLTKELVAYAGHPGQVLQNVDLTDIVRESEPVLRALVPDQCEIIMDIPASSLVLQCNPSQVRQALINMVANAAEAVPDRGHIRVGCHPIDLVGGEVTPVYPIAESISGRFACLRVTDDGAGMSEEEAARAFDPFYSTKTVGRGLGLATVLGTARSHRGAIAMDTEPGEGTTLKLMLPVAGPRAEEQARSEADDAVTEASGTILVADDDDPVREVVGEYLSQAGYDVVLAQDGQEAVELFEARGDEIALVILDIMMPRLDGREAFRIIREQSPSVPVIFSSGYDKRSSVSRFTGEDIQHFLQKPFRPSELLRLVRSVLDPGG